MLLKSIDKPDPEIEKTWALESEKRYANYKKKLTKGSSLEDFKKRMKK